MKKVTIVQHRLLHYRTELFEIMRVELLKNNIVLNLVHGQASLNESMRKDEASLPWAEKIKNYFFYFRGVDVIWQNLPKGVNNCDLLILMQENRIISNYLNIFFRNLLGKKTAYWGHGRNLQSTHPNGLREQWKKVWLKSVDYWFAYTATTVSYLSSQGYPVDNIICLNNAIDVNSFKQDLKNVTQEQIVSKMIELQIPIGSDVGVFCGSLYKEKRLDLLLEAVDIIKAENSKFFVVIIGDGPSAHLLHSASLTRPWLKMVGVQKGLDKAVYYRFSSIMLNPGLVGLHILDSFCASLPMVTTIDALHSPEFDYLTDNVNGLVTKGTSNAYAQAILDLLADKSRLETMKSAAFHSSLTYTVENMALNFTYGIVNALNSRE